MVLVMNSPDPLRRTVGSRQATNLNLSYVDINIGGNGSVLSATQIREIRLKQGFCTECRGEPIRLYDVKKNKFNPLWSTRSPRTVDGESLEGQCLLCHPELDPNRRNRRNHHFGHNRQNLGSSTAASAQARRTSAPVHPGLFTSGRALRDDAERLCSSNHEGTTTSSGGAFLDAIAEVQRETTERDRLGEDMDDSEMSTRRGGGRRLASRSVRRQGSDDDANGPSPRLPDLDSDRDDAAAPPSQPRRPPLAPAFSDPTHMSTAQHAEEAFRDDQSQVSENLEIMYAHCRRMSSMRNLRQPSFRGLPSSESPRERSVSPDPPSASERSQHPPVSLSAPQSEPHVQTSPSSPVIPESHEEPVRSDSEIVRELETLIKDLSVAGNSDFTSDVLVNAMKEAPHSTAIQQFCLSSIWDLCKDSDSYKTSIMSTSAPDDILLAMANHMSSPSIQERGCGALWALSVNKMNRVIVIRAGAPARIVRALMEHTTNENVIRSAIGALRTLSPETEVRESLGALQATRRVVEAMEYHRTSASIQRDGCAFLSNSAVDLETQTVSIASKAELEAIVNAMQVHRDEPSVIGGACFALKNYTYDEENLKTLSGCSGAFDILQHASNSSAMGSSCQRDADIVLERMQLARLEGASIEDQALASLNELVHQHNVPGDAVNTVLNVINDETGSEKLIAGALESLTSLVNRSELHASKVTKSVINQIVRLMQSKEGALSIQIQSCALLECLGERDTKFRYHIIDAQGCVAISDAMRHHRSSMELLVAAGGALKALSVEFECWFELEQSGNIGAIREVIGSNSGSAVLQQIAEDIFTNFSGHSDMINFPPVGA